MIDFIRSSQVGRHGTPTTQVAILEGTQSAFLQTRATHTTSVERTNQPTMTGHKPNSHKKRAPTRHKYKQTLHLEKKRRVANSDISNFNTGNRIYCMINRLRTIALA